MLKTPVATLTRVASSLLPSNAIALIRHRSEDQRSAPPPIPDTPLTRAEATSRRECEQTLMAIDRCFPANPFEDQILNKASTELAKKLRETHLSCLGHEISIEGDDIRKAIFVIRLPDNRFVRFDRSTGKASIGKQPEGSQNIDALQFATFNYVEVLNSQSEALYNFRKLLVYGFEGCRQAAIKEFATIK